MDRQRHTCGRILLFLVLAFLLGMNTYAAPAKKVTLAVGGKQTLKASGLKNSKAKWTSSNKKVVQVSAAGAALGKKAGKATVTAVAGKKKYTWSVTVKKAALSATKKTMFAGSKMKLSLKAAAKTDKITWKSSGKAVASVDKKGNVTALKAGKTVISAAFGGKTFSCSVTVKNPTLNVKLLSLEKGGKYNLSLSGGVKPKWSSSNTAVATVSSGGQVKGVGGGTARILAKVGSQTLVCQVNVAEMAKLSASVVTISPGARYTLYLRGAGGSKSWKSSDASVASVSTTGMITAKKAGSTAVTVSCAGKSYNCNVTVKAPAKTTAVKKKTVTVTVTTPVKGVSDTETTSKAMASSSSGSSGSGSSSKSSSSSGSSGSSSSSKSGTSGYSVSNDGKYIYPSGSPEAKAYKTLIGFKKKYPEGMTFTNDDFRSWVGGIYRGGYGCAGFCFELSDACFAPNLAVMRTTGLTSGLRPGDIIRLDYNTHSVTVLEVYTDHVVVAEANYNSSVHWGRIITYAEIRQTGTNVITRYAKSTAAEVKGLMQIINQLPCLGSVDPVSH